MDELAQYRKERLWDADAFFKNPAFSGLVRRFLEHPEDAEALPQLQEWAAKYLVTEQYDLVCLFDAQGVIRMAVPAEPPISSFVSQNIPEILRTGQVIFQDFTRNEHDQRVYLALLVPIFDESDANRPLGVLALRIDPETYLYPFIQRWPTPSRTGETLLVRREGNDALFLNELKFGTNTALSLRVTLANTNVPAVKAVLGHEGVVEGMDYRGAPALAALQAVPDSPWSLVAKMDTAEVYAPLRERLRLTILLVGLLLVSTGTGIGAIWRHQRVRFYKVRYQMTEALRRSEAKFRTLYDSTSDAVMLLDEKGFFDCNPAALAVYGCATREEFCSKHPADVSPPMQPDGTDSRTLANQRIATALEKGTNHFEWTHKRVDTGETFTADVLLSAMELDGKPVLQAVVRDVTERKRTDEAVRASEVRYRRLFEAARDGILILDAVTGRVVDANPFLAEILGLSHKEFLGKTVWELGFFKNIVANQAKFEELQKQEYIRYEDLPMKTSDGRQIHVEFVSNVYQVNQHKVIQCNIRDITARKQAEAALHQEQTLMATLMENVPDAFYFKDAASRFLRVNRALSRKFGLSDPAQLVGKSDTDFFSGEHARQALADEQEILRTGRPLLNVEEKETWMDGTVSWVLTTKLPLRDATGRIIGTCGISRDITERKRAEEALRESRALYYSLAEQLPIGVFRKDREGRYVLVNPEFCRLKGMKAEDFLGKTPGEVAAVEAARQGEMGPATKYAATGAEQHEQILQTGKSIELVEEYVHADGRKQFLRVLKSPVIGPDGKVIGTQGIQFDITERKLAEETIAHERQLLRTLIDRLPETFYIKDLDGRFLVVNEALAKRWGKENPSQLLGLSDTDLFPAEQAAGFRAEELKVFAGEPVINRESLSVFADGREHTMLTTKLPFRDSQGRICGLVGIGHDITERKQAEATIARERQLLRTLIDLLPDTFYIKDLEGRFLVVNEVLARQWGKENPSQMLGLSDADLFPAGLAAEFRAEELKVFGGEPVINRESICVYYDGRDHTVITSKVPFRDSQGRICGLVGIGHDITERKQATQRIADELNFNQTVLRASPVGIAVFKATGPCISANETIGQITGGSREEVLKQDFRQLESWKDCGMLAAAEAALAAQAERSLDTQITTTFGRKAWFSCRFAPFHYEGEPHLLLMVNDITERKRSEEALRESEARFRRLSDATFEAVAIHKRGVLLNANDQYFKLFGYTPDQLLGKEVLSLTVAPEALGYMMKQVDGGGLGPYETIGVRKDGTRFPMEIRVREIEQDGQIIRVGAIRDITERKRAEEALKESEVRYQRISEAITDYIYTVRVADGRAMETTHGPGCLAVTGYRPEEFTNDRFLWLRMVAAEDRPMVEEQARRILAGEDPPPIEHRIVQKNGTVRWVRNTFVPHRDERGALMAYDGLIQDITGRKRAEEALRWSETQLHVILESTADGLLAVDSKGKVIKASKRFAEFWRIPKSLMDAGDDRALLDFVLEQLTDADAFLKKVQSLYGSDAVDMDTLAFKDGRIFERHSFPMMMDGAVIGRVWSFRDITERKRQEREISEKSVELERFTYTVSHDLKSPLVTVKTFLGYLEQDLLNPDAERIKQDVGYMRTAADKMGHLLDELLNLARVGRKSNPPVRVTFQELAREAVGLVAGRISTSGTEVQVADAAVVLEGDRPRLVEIWQNLVENACKFMADQPKPRVEIGVEQRGGETVFFVRDNGAGIEPRYQEKVFSLFEKLNPKLEGTGMGLALVKRVVELHKGRIWVESGGHGQGANFLFTLPAAVIMKTEQSS